MRYFRIIYIDIYIYIVHCASYRSYLGIYKESAVLAIDKLNCRRLESLLLFLIT